MYTEIARRTLYADPYIITINNCSIEVDVSPLFPLAGGLVSVEGFRLVIEYGTFWA